MFCASASSSRIKIHSITLGHKTSSQVSPTWLMCATVPTGNRVGAFPPFLRSKCSKERCVNEPLEASQWNVVDEYVSKVIEVCNGIGDGEKLKVEGSSGFGWHARFNWEEVIDIFSRSRERHQVHASFYFFLSAKWKWVQCLMARNW